MEELNDDKFIWKNDDIKFRSQNGEYIKNENLKDYFDNRKKEMLTITDNLNVGDVVKLKLTGEIVIIDKIDYANFKYAGYVQGESSLTLFSQEDVEEIMSKSQMRSI